MVLSVLLVFGVGFLFAGFLGLLLAFAEPKEAPAKPEEKP